MFRLLGRQVQGAGDPRFNRARYDADQTIVAYVARLNDTMDVNSIRNDLATVVDQARNPFMSRRG
jgi:hypothetical protein